jgi:cytochrome c553
MKIRLLTVSVLLGWCFSGTGVAGGSMSGASLFEYYGCINCHGAEAKNPVSDVVPSLARKSADKLYSKAKMILSGNGGTKEARLMHAALYSPSQCDSPPTDAELHSITTWISQR